MLTFRGAGPRLCDGQTRREAMQIGGLGLLGLGLPSLLGSSLRGTALSSGSAAAAETTGARVIPSGGKAKSCILLFLMGGPPQHSTFDPKPDAPAEVRGEFGPVATNVPGIQFADCLPRLSKVADKLCVLRAVSTGDNAHSSSGYYMLTGRPHAPMNRENANPGAPNDWPCLAAIVQRLAAARGELPSGIRLPKHIFNTDGSVWPGQDAGFLGRNADPWLFRCEPASPNFQIPEFQLPVDVPAERLNGRHSLLRDFNQHLNQVEQRGALDHYDGLTRRAFGLLSSNESRAALDLSREPEALRQRYGMTQFGQSTLLARRLIDAGVRLVQVNWFRGPDEPTDAPCWDSHTNEAARLRNVLAAPADMAFATLVEDLHARGMLDETLVVCLGEFGRTPRLNARAGRDHWGPVFSIAMAGGGVRGGMVHGASDRIGGQPKDGMVRPEDVAATIFHCLGFAPGTALLNAQGKQLPISTGQVIEPILA